MGIVSQNLDLYLLADPDKFKNEMLSSSWMNGTHTSLKSAQNMSIKLPTVFKSSLLSAGSLRNFERRNSILMTHHYPDGSVASDWLKQIFACAPFSLHLLRTCETSLAAGSEKRR